MTYKYKQLSISDLALLRDLINLFGEVFENSETYQGSIPHEKYLQDFLSSSNHIILTAQEEAGNVVGGLVAYELEKFEQERKEIYVYDLAVSKQNQRKGVASSLFAQLKLIAKEKGAYVIFVHADKSDTSAVSFYRSLADEEIETYNFDVKV